MSVTSHHPIYCIATVKFLNNKFLFRYRYISLLGLQKFQSGLFMAKEKKTKFTYKPYHKLSRSQQWRRKISKNLVISCNWSQHIPTTANSSSTDAIADFYEACMPTGTSTSFSISDELVPVSDPHSSSLPIHGIGSETNVSIGQQTIGPDTLKRLLHGTADSNNISIKEDIASWILTEKHVPKTAISTLLRILHKHHKTLPLSVSTLLPPPRLRFNQMQGGEYVHLPNWIPSLKNLISIEPSNKSIHLLINIDGLPLFQNSPNFKVYPILISILGIKSRPICVGIYCTNKNMNREMPPPNLFLADFLNDLAYLNEQGIEVHGAKFVIEHFGTYICDAPARSSLKLIKSHSGYNSCERCDIKGEYHDGKVCFLGKGNRRTDDSFKNQIDKMHHKGSSILADMNVNMVSNFVLDHMHLVFLGVMKRLLAWWKGVPR